MEAPAPHVESGAAMIEFEDEKPKPTHKPRTTTGIDSIVEHTAVRKTRKPKQHAARPDITPSDGYLDHLAALGLPHATAAALFGYSQAASYGWAKGSTSVPAHITLLLALARENGLAHVETVKARYGMSSR